mmetsp:Transcript_12262/g.17448  ORF Transcript_12262/g.17448 Transcript_12262/m.17448 type:complete len:692 (+) Transcript_12262:60-2135(+)
MMMQQRRRRCPNNKFIPLAMFVSITISLGYYGILTTTTSKCNALVPIIKITTITTTTIQNININILSRRQWKKNVMTHHHEKNDRILQVEAGPFGFGRYSPFSSRGCDSSSPSRDVLLARMGRGSPTGNRNGGGGGRGGGKNKRSGRVGGKKGGGKTKYTKKGNNSNNAKNKMSSFKPKNTNRMNTKMNKQLQFNDYDDNYYHDDDDESYNRNNNHHINEKQSHGLPPWQVMSQKNIKKNIQREIKRRDKIQKGEIPTHMTQYDDDDDAITTHNNHDDHESTSSTSTSSSSHHHLLLTPTERSLLSWKSFHPESLLQKGGGGTTSLNFMGSYLDKRVPPSMGVPEIAFLGRSNVGKSSLLNRLSLGNSQGGSGGTSNNSGGGGSGARVGKTPGATASVNLYILSKTFKKKNYDITTNHNNHGKPLLGLVDLPGFGYAKLSKTIQEDVVQTAERYIQSRKNRELACGVLLVDARRIPSQDDRAVLAALYDMDVPLVVVATKVDKLTNKREEGKQLECIREGLGLPDNQPLAISSRTGRGVKELWKILLDACEDRVEELRLDLEGVSGAERKRKKKEEEEEGFEDYGEGEEGETILLDEEGNWIQDDDFYEEDDLEYDQGYEWAHTYDEYDAYDDLDEDKSNNKMIYDDDNLDDSDPYLKRNENEEMQAAAKEAMKLKNLKRTVRGMERKGQL